jgi:hypothetical protein
VAVTWAEASDENEETTETEAHGEVDETFASRRLRRWLRGMFGGGTKPPPDQPDRDSDGA